MSNIIFGKAVKYVFSISWIRIFSQPLRRYIHKRETVSWDQTSWGYHKGRLKLFIIRMFIHYYNFNLSAFEIIVCLQRSGFQTDGPSGGGKPNKEAARKVSSYLVCVCMQDLKRTELNWIAMESPSAYVHSHFGIIWQKVFFPYSYRPSKTKGFLSCESHNATQLHAATGTVWI